MPVFVEGGETPKGGQVGGAAVGPGGIPSTDPRSRASVPSAPHLSGYGMSVMLQAIPGVTPAKVFRGLPGNVFYFQCPPMDVFPVERSWTWDDYATINAGMHSNPSYRQLKTITFSTLLVDNAWIWEQGNTQIRGPRFATASLPQAADTILWAVDFLERLGNSLKPFQIAWGQQQLWGRWDGHMVCTLRSYHSEERANEDDARYLTLSVTEYADADDVTLAPPPQPPGGNNTSHRGGYTTADGQKVIANLNSAQLPPSQDSLAELAKKYYGDPAMWKLIAKASGLTAVGPNTDLNTSAAAGKKKPPARVVVPADPRPPKSPYKGSH